MDFFFVIGMHTDRLVYWNLLFQVVIILTLLMFQSGMKCVTFHCVPGFSLSEWLFTYAFLMIDYRFSIGLAYVDTRESIDLLSCETA